MTSTEYTPHAELLSKTPEQLREMAQGCYRSREDSWQRSDTDGFMTQWAMSVTARLYEFAADLASLGWQQEMDALFDLDGNLLDAVTGSGQYGPYWMIRNADGSRRFVNVSMARKADRRRKFYEGKGVRVGRVLRHVIPVMRSGGAMSCYPSVEPDRKRPEVTIVSADEPGEDF